MLVAAPRASMPSFLGGQLEHTEEDRSTELVGSIETAGGVGFIKLIRAIGESGSPSASETSWLRGSCMEGYPATP